MIRTKLLTAAFAALATSVASAGPIGTLDVDAAYDLRSEDSAGFVRFTGESATWYSGDTLRTRNGVAVVNFDQGGAIGVRENSQVTLSEDDAGRLRAELVSGEVMVALSAEQSAFELVSGNFLLTPSLPEGRMQVALGENAVATVRRLEDGNLKVDVQSGEFDIRNGDSMQISVSSGESIGLLDVPAVSARKVQDEVAAEVPFVAPEDVGPQEDFQVDWGENEIPVGDYLAVAPVDSDPSMFDSVVRIGPEKVIPVVAPSAEGEYEIRIIDESTGAVRIWAPLTVSRPEGLFIPVSNASQVGGNLLGYGVAAAAGAASMYIIRTRPCNCDPGSISP